MAVECLLLLLSSFSITNAFYPTYHEILGNQGYYRDFYTSASNQENQKVSEKMIVGVNLNNQSNSEDGHSNAVVDVPLPENATSTSEPEAENVQTEAQDVTTEALTDKSTESTSEVKEESPPPKKLMEPSKVIPRKEGVYDSPPSPLFSSSGNYPNSNPYTSSHSGYPGSYPRRPQYEGPPYHRLPVRPYKNVRQMYDTYDAYDVAYRSDFYWLIPLVIIIGIGVLILPLFSLFMTAMVSNGAINLTGRRRKRRSVNEDNDFPDQLVELVAHVEEVLTQLSQLFDEHTPKRK